MISDINTRSIAVLLNGRAGKGRANKIAAMLQLQLQKNGIDYTVFNTVWPEELTEFSDIYIIGGDGTLNYFINRYPGIKIPVTLFKGGSGNDFHFKIYGKISFNENVNIGLTGRTKAIDAGLCNGKYFINGFGTGFDGMIVKSMEGKNKISAGYIAYLAVVLKHLLFYKEKKLSVSFDAETYSEKFFMVTVANASRYGGGFMVSPESVIDDGGLNFVAIQKIHPIKRLINLNRLKKGNHLQLNFVKSHLISEIQIQADSLQAAHIDGELLIAKSFSIKILPNYFLFRRG